MGFVYRLGYFFREPKEGPVKIDSAYLGRAFTVPRGRQLTRITRLAEKTSVITHTKRG